MKCNWTVKTKKRLHHWRSPVPLSIEMAWAIARIHFKNATNIW